MRSADNLTTFMWPNVTKSGDLKACPGQDGIALSYTTRTYGTENKVTRQLAARRDYSSTANCPTKNYRDISTHVWSFSGNLKNFYLRRQLFFWGGDPSLVNASLEVRKIYQLDANNFTMIFSHKWPLHVSDIYMSIFRSSYI